MNESPLTKSAIKTEVHDEIVEDGEIYSSESYECSESTFEVNLDFMRLVNKFLEFYFIILIADVRIDNI